MTFQTKNHNLPFALYKKGKGPTSLRGATNQ